jgi:hypothetical protein
MEGRDAIDARRGGGSARRHRPRPAGGGVADPDEATPHTWSQPCGSPSYLVMIEPWQHGIIRGMTRALHIPLTRLLPPVPCALRGHSGVGLRRPDMIWSPAQGLRGKHTSMTCPACQIDLHMTESQGIEIDYPPQCRGVWFDRGNSTNTSSARVRTAPPRLPPTGMRMSVAPPLRTAGMMTRMSATGPEDCGAHRS